MKTMVKEDWRITLRFVVIRRMLGTTERQSILVQEWRQRRTIFSRIRLWVGSKLWPSKHTRSYHHLSLVDSLSRFQNSKVNDQIQEWHMLVPTQAQVALGKQEVRRQSIMFEIIKGERDYVADLELVQTVCKAPVLSWLESIW